MITYVTDTDDPDMTPEEIALRKLYKEAEEARKDLQRQLYAKKRESTDLLREIQKLYWARHPR